MLDKSQTKISGTPGKFIRDNTFELIYFLPGSDDFSISDDKIFSKQLLDLFADTSKHYIIEGFVDIATDTPYLKENKLSDKVFTITGAHATRGSDDELKALQIIYQDMATSNSDMTIDVTHINSENLRHAILSLMTLDISDYQVLSYKRINKIRNIMIQKYNISPNAISTNENNITDNPYISGVGNCLGVVTSGRKDF